ncbi:hypothetical protein N9N67_06730 [Bacteriovoracaceae bacterium]|nr:hypothetical protein [Bacteriovoracaceae bacterium]
MKLVFLSLLCFHIFNLQAQEKFKFKLPVNESIYKKQILSSPQGSVVWSTKNLDELTNYVQNEIKHILLKQGRDPLVYRQVNARSWDMEVELSHNSSSVNFYIHSSNANGRITKQSILKVGKNIVKIHNIHNISSLRIVAYSDKFVSLNYSLKINKYTIKGNIPKKIVRENKDYKPNLPIIEVPIPVSSVYCGIPQNLFQKNVWKKIESNLNLISDYCNFLKYANLIKKAYDLPPLNQPPAEPLKPKEIVSPEDYLKESNAEKPVKIEINDKELRKIIAKEYDPYAYINISNAFTTNSAYLVDMSTTVNGAPLRTIKSELQIQLEMLEEPHTISVYRMSYRRNRRRVIFFENFKGKNRQPGKLKTYSSVIKNIFNDDPGGITTSDDMVIHSFRAALENKKIDTINILSDVGFEEFRRHKGEQLINKMRKEIKRSNRSITVNVYNFSGTVRSSWKSWCEEIVKLGTGEGQFFTDKKLRPAQAKVVLQKIRDTYDPIKKETLIEEYQKEENERFEKDMAVWEEKRQDQIKESKAYIEKYEEYLLALEVWEGEHSDWEAEMKTFRDKEKLIYNKLADNNIQFIDLETFRESLESFIKDSTTSEEVSFYKELEEMLISN